MAIDTRKTKAQLIEELQELRQLLIRAEIVTSQDISHLKSDHEKISAGEYRYRELFNNINNGVAVYKPNDDGSNFFFLDFNKAAERIEKTSKKEVIGKSVLDVFPGVREFGLFDVLIRVWQTGKPEHHPVTIYHDHRISGWRENYVYKLPTGEIVAVYDDITELKQAEEKLVGVYFDMEKKVASQAQVIITINKKLMHADKLNSLGRLAATLAHEIRNPLSGININLSTLEKICSKQCNHQTIENLFSQIKLASRSIESVIRRVMDYSKSITPLFRQADVNQSINEAFTLIGVAFRKAGVKTEKELQGNLPLIQLDPQLFVQVMVNLLTNAIDAVRKLPGEKKIKVISILKQNMISVTVADNGSGIAPDLVSAVFAPFFTTKADGTGIGLSICERIILDHDGSIHVGSSQWGGAAFTINLPLEKGKNAIL